MPRVKVFVIVSILLITNILTGCGSKAEDTAERHTAQGSTLLEQHRFDEAIKELNRAIQLDPNYAKAYVTRAHTYSGKKQYNLAIADGNKAIELDPDLAEAYVVVGLAYYYDGQYDLAITNYNKAIELDTSQGEAVYLGRALVYEKQGKKAEAKAEWEKLITVTNDPKLIEGAKKEIEKLSQ